MYILNKGKGFINSLSQLYTIDRAKRDTEMRFGKRGQDGGGGGENVIRSTEYIFHTNDYTTIRSYVISMQCGMGEGLVTIFHGDRNIS